MTGRIISRREVPKWARPVFEPTCLGLFSVLWLDGYLWQYVFEMFADRVTFIRLAWFHPTRNRSGGISHVTWSHPIPPEPRRGRGQERYQQWLRSGAADAGVAFGTWLKQGGAEG